MRRTLAAAVFALLAIGTLAAPAGAAPHPAAPAAGTDGFVPFCTGEPAPSPQWSQSNQTVHYGLKIICNYYADIWVKVTLFTIVGTGDREKYVWQNYDENSCVAKDCFAGRTPTCSVFTSGRWILREEGTVDGSPPNNTPLPKWGSVVTLPLCSDVLTN